MCTFIIFHLVFRVVCFTFMFMNAKEQFLKRIKDQIKVLQDAYEYNSTLPDHFFDNMLFVANDKPSLDVAKAGTHSTVRPDKYVDVSEYGANRRLIIDILRTEGVGMVKWNIASRFAELTGKKQEEIDAMITNGISGLKQEGSIKGYKPEGLRFKGFFWTLSHWWDGDTLKKQHRPFQGKVSQL